MRSSPLLVFSVLVSTLGACRGAGGTAVQPESKVSTAPPSADPPAFSARDIDKILRVAWAKDKIVPAHPVDDERFLRRIYLDIVGRIPSIEEVRAFAADRAPDRRARAVDGLLQSKGYADHFTNYWNDVLLGDDIRGKVIDGPGFRDWLHAQFEKNVPYDRMVYALVTAAGVNRDKAEEETAAPTPAAPTPAAAEAAASPMMKGESPAEASPRAVFRNEQTNAAVNWLIKYKDTPQDLAGNVSSTFLGIRIQCAQCHDHKTEKWTQEDFRRFAACFMRTRTFSIETGEGGPRRLAIEDVPRLPGKLAKNPEFEPMARAAPHGLDGTDFSSEPNRREALGRWLASSSNPWFAKAIVNRMWGEFLGHGFVEPVDDFRASNPALVPELLDRMALEFVRGGYDLKALIKIIVGTEAYQLASEPIAGSSEPGALWSRFPLKPLGPDELLDSVAVATDLDEMLAHSKDSDFAKAKAQLRKQFNFLFDVDEESHPATYEGTIPQALMLMNGKPLARVTNTARHGALLKVLSLPDGDDQRLEALFLRTLSRKPTADEKSRLLVFVGEVGGKKLERFEDLMWALLNSSEFVFNH